MLLNKKSKGVQEKNKVKNAEPVKKLKKNKNLSPNKQKVTPEKKKIKKDENVYSNRLAPHANTQTIQFHKSKDKEILRASNTKRNPVHDHKNKLLTTSPVVFERSTSNSKKRSKDKSKSRSVSRINTHRSNNADKEKSFIKNVTKRLYTQTKECNREKSMSKSKSKSKSRGHKDTSPLKDPKHAKSFNVADRQVKYKKSETMQLKKALKKKVQNKMRGEGFLYPPTDRLVMEDIQEPKIKLKKKIPQIKTEFSQRRGSYFDQNLLQKLELGQLKKQQICPFLHIKSSFEYKRQNVNGELYSRSEMKTYEQTNQESQFKVKQIQNFKKDQEQKWNKMLFSLQNLKNEQMIPQKIDELIKQLNQNYSSLQQKSYALFKNAAQSNSSQQNLAQNIAVPQRQLVSQNSMLQSESEEQFIRYVKTKSVESQLNKYLKPKASLQKHKIEQGQGQGQEQKQKYIKYGKEIQPIKVDIYIQPQNQKYVFQPQKDILPEHIQPSAKQEQLDIAKQKKVSISEVIQNENSNRTSSQRPQQPEFKKSNNIALNNDFFDFFHNKESSNLKRELLSSALKRQGEPQQKRSPHEIKMVEEPKSSDKNLLQQLDILEGGSSYIQIVSFSKQNKNQFLAQMQQIRQIQSQEFHKMPHPLDLSPNFDQEIKMQDLSSESMLLPSTQLVSNSNKKLETLVSEIEHILILQFCTSILRSKEILHNFLTTYSQLVDQNVINVEYAYDEGRPNIACSNQHVLQVFQRLINHFQINYKQLFMRQIQIPFECKPIQILRFIRCVEEDAQSLNLSERDISQNAIIMPFFGLEKIEQFQTDILKNQYYIPNYFSFNHCVYDMFNDIFDDLRPYGTKGKPFFSLQLGHAITIFDQAKKLFLQKAERTIALKYYQQPISQQKYPNQQGVFQLTYFTCLDLIQQIFDEQASILYQVLNRQTR